MKKFSLKSLFIAAGILAAAALALNTGSKHPSTASLVIDYGNGKAREFTGEIVKDMSIYDALWASSRAGSFKIPSQFNIKLNDRPIPANMIGQTAIKNGDIIKIELP